MNGDERKKWREAESKRDRGNTSWKKESGLGMYTAFFMLVEICMNTDRADAPSFVYNDKTSGFLDYRCEGGNYSHGNEGRGHNGGQAPKR